MMKEFFLWKSDRNISDIFLADLDHLIEPPYCIDNDQGLKVL